MKRNVILLPCCPLDALLPFLKIFREPCALANKPHTYALFYYSINLVLYHKAKKFHQVTDLILATLPVLGRERIGYNVGDFCFSRPAHDLCQSIVPNTVPLKTRLSLFFCPSTVAIHNDADTLYRFFIHNNISTEYQRNDILPRVPPIALQHDQHAKKLTLGEGGREVLEVLFPPLVRPPTPNHRDCFLPYR